MNVAMNAGWMRGWVGLRVGGSVITAQFVLGSAGATAYH